MTPLRGQVFRVDLGHGPKPWLVVSNNARNRNLESVVAVRVTTILKNAHVPTVVPLHHSDPVVDLVGAVGPETMRAVSVALRIALP